VCANLQLAVVVGLEGDVFIVSGVAAVMISVVVAVVGGGGGIVTVKDVTVDIFFLSPSLARRPIRGNTNELDN